MKVFLKQNDNEDSTLVEEKPLSAAECFELDRLNLAVAHRYVLFNSEIVEPFLNVHIDELKEKHSNLENNQTLLWNRHSEGFPLWFYDKVVFYF